MRQAGLIGTGVMGTPIAANLLRAGIPLVIWNRSVERTRPLSILGAIVASSSEDVFARCDLVILMLANGDAMDQVLDRGGSTFAERVRGRTIVHMGTTSAEYSANLDSDIRAVGGRYVEAPVSGSRGPAESGELVVMMAGDNNGIRDLAQLLPPISKAVFECGAVPRALCMKLSVNVFLISMVTGLVECFQLADSQGLDVEMLRRILDAGPMASIVSRAKGAKLAAGDFLVQAGVSDVLKNAELAAEAARIHASASPVLDASCALYREAQALGHGAEDMVAVLRALQARSTKLRGSAPTSDWAPRET